LAKPWGNKYLSDSEKGLFLNPESKKLNLQKFNPPISTTST